MQATDITDIKMIGIDLDETLLTHEKTISPRVLNAVRRAVEAGIVVLPASGRALNGIPAEVAAMPGVEYALTANGARVYRLAGREVLISHCFEKADALEIFDAVAPFDILTSFFIDGQGYIDKQRFHYQTENTSEVIRRYLMESRRPIDDLRGFLVEATAPLEKFSLYFRSPEERARVWRVLEQRGGLTITSSVATNIEVNTEGTNKGMALLALAQSLGIQPGQVMAIGDSLNDLEMIRAAGVGVAMGNALPEIKAAADHITLSNQEDGVAVVLERLLQ